MLVFFDEASAGWGNAIYNQHSEPVFFFHSLRVRFRLVDGDLPSLPLATLLVCPIPFPPEYRRSLCSSLRFRISTATFLNDTPIGSRRCRNGDEIKSDASLFRLRITTSSSMSRIRLWSCPGGCPIFGKTEPVAQHLYHQHY